MSAQLALGYAPAYVGGEVWRERLEVLRLAVGHLGLKEVAWALDVSKTLLSDSLNERDRKRWAGEWSDVVKQMLVQLIERGDETARDLYRQLAGLDLAHGPFALGERVELTPEEEAAALRRELLKFGDAGKTAVERVRKRGRR